MDAKERLRRYLEQRRELGESELVLDSMPVEDVMQLLGARAMARGAGADRVKLEAPSRKPAGDASAQVPSTDAPASGSDAKPEVLPPPIPQLRVVDTPVSADWRTALADTAPPSPTLPGSTSALTVGGKGDGKIKPAPIASPSTGVVPAFISALNVPIGLHAGSASMQQQAAILAPDIAQLPTLADIAHRVSTCTRCDLGRSALNPVPGEGNPDADFVCVGEAPGQTEDEQGRPFVGAAGQLLTKILGAIQLSREDVFICNVLKHRPPGNRDPLPQEVLACAPYLLRQLELLQPKVILALGNFAARTLLGTDQPIGKLRGSVHFFHGVPLICTYHPAALLRNEAWKRPAWEDVQLARRVYDAARAQAST